jgi:hypothetical protein
MPNLVRLIMVAGTRMFEFMLAFPDPNPGFMEATQALGERLARAEALANQQRNGKVDRRVSTGQREALLKKLRVTFLRTLAAVAAVAFKEDPEVVRRFRVHHRDTGTDFLTAARTVLAEAEGVHDALLQKGLPETLLADLRTGLDEYDKLVTEANAGWRAHVGASADLEAVAEEVMGIVRHLDALNRFRYHNNPEQLAAWLSARHIPWGKGDKEVVVPAAPTVAAPAVTSPQPTS